MRPTDALTGLVAPCAEHIMRRARTGCVRNAVACTGGRAAVLHACAGPGARGRRAPWRTLSDESVVEGLSRAPVMSCAFHTTCAPCGATT